MKKFMLLFMLIFLANVSVSMDINNVSYDDAMKMHEESLRKLALFFLEDIKKQNKINKDTIYGFIPNKDGGLRVEHRKSKARL